jgi:hypothetical protein
MSEPLPAGFGMKTQGVRATDIAKVNASLGGFSTSHWWFPPVTVAVPILLALSPLLNQEQMRLSPQTLTIDVIGCEIMWTQQLLSTLPGWQHIPVNHCTSVTRSVLIP